jgi:hypothetical protein
MRRCRDESSSHLHTRRAVAKSRGCECVTGTCLTGVPHLRATLGHRFLGLEAQVHLDGPGDAGKVETDDNLQFARLRLRGFRQYLGQREQSCHPEDR